MSTPPSSVPASLAKACDDDGSKSGRCPCGNCSNAAVLQTCLRYTKSVEDKGWTLVGCKPGFACDVVFPSEELRKNDIVLACPCKGRGEPSSCAPTPEEWDPPVEPPNWWHRLGTTLARGLGYLALAVACFLAVIILLRFLRRRREFADTRMDVDEDYTSMDMPPDAMPQRTAVAQSSAFSAAAVSAAEISGLAGVLPLRLRLRRREGNCGARVAKGASKRPCRRLTIAFWNVTNADLSKGSGRSLGKSDNAQYSCS